MEGRSFQVLYKYENGNPLGEMQEMRPSVVYEKAVLVSSMVTAQSQ